MVTILLDSNVYDALDQDPTVRSMIATLIAQGDLRMIATPKVLDELHSSPFGGLPDWFPVELEAESAFVLGHAQLGMARLGSGDIYTQHRGESSKVPDAIIADSAHASADILVTEDKRCRKRLQKISDRCRAMTYSEFHEWLVSQD
jgi:hypothetical protein